MPTPEERHNRWEEHRQNDKDWHRARAGRVVRDLVCDPCKRDEHKNCVRPCFCRTGHWSRS